MQQIICNLNSKEGGGLNRFRGYLTSPSASGVIQNIKGKSKGKGLLFNVVSLRKSTSGMDGTSYLEAEPTVLVITSLLCSSLFDRMVKL